MTPREAKEFLVAQIVAEADFEGIPLNDIERKMLYFTETAWMPEDTWEASEEFDQRYDQTAYEDKVAALIQKARKRNPTTHSQWRDAIDILSKEDHYLLVMINYQRLGKVPGTTRPPYDGLKLVLTAILVIGILFVATLLYQHFIGR